LDANGSIDSRLEQFDADGAVRETADQTHSILEHEGDTRAAFLKKAGLTGGAVLGGGAIMGALVPGTAIAGGRPPSSFGKGDIGILNFALTLEYLEYEFYLEATKNNDATPFVDGQLKVFLDTVTADEKAHVDFLEAALGKKALKEPKFDFGTTTSNKDEFVATAFALENTGVKAYSGQALNIKDPGNVKAALSILTIEARHASVIGLIQSGDRKGIAPDGPFDKALTAKKVLKAVAATGFIQG